MENSEILKNFFLEVVEGVKNDAASKGQKIPLSSFRFEADNQAGQLYAADYFQYLVEGRSPGKQPPVDTMRAFVDDNPEILDHARQLYADISRESLAYLIGRKIGKQGTNIFQGKKPGIDLDGVLREKQEQLFKSIVGSMTAQVLTKIRQAGE